MDNLFKEEEKINLFAKIQKIMCSLTINSQEKEINKIFDIIPPGFLDEKENLFVIVQLFGTFARNHGNMHKITIKLFQRIMDQMKKKMKNESSFFWTALGGILFLKRWFYEEGLISIDFIICSAMSFDTSLIARYFLPEILEKNPTYFHKEMKYNFPDLSNPDVCSDEQIQKFKELRLKHFKWICESADYFDPVYREIETNQLRLSIKLDDISTFQTILSQSNISINSTISESIVEYFQSLDIRFRLISYAVEYNASNIFNFLLLNDAELNEEVLISAVYRENYDIIHIFESRIPDTFKKIALGESIFFWNHEICQYMLDNYGYNYLFENENKMKSESESESENENEIKNESESENENEIKSENENEIISENENKIKSENENKIKNENESKSEDEDRIGNDAINRNEINVDIENDEFEEDKDKNGVESSIIQICNDTFYSFNFRFFQSILLPFLRKHPRFVHKNIQKILLLSSNSNYPFFTKEFLKYPGIDINHVSPEDDSILKYAIGMNNKLLTQELLKNHELNVNVLAYDDYSILCMACLFWDDVEILKMLCKHPSIDIHFGHLSLKENAFQLALVNGNVFAAEIFADYFKDIKKSDLSSIAMECFLTNHFISLQFIVKFCMKKYEGQCFDKVINDFKKLAKNDQYSDELDEAIQEIRKNNE